jgi:chromosome segregation protein
MRLKKIKLAGFKSFVDPTTISFPSNLIGIVGPNGCGKSNIIDAVRWVMGESSAKHLRGDALADVIFNGSTGRKPVGQAGIELVFDNNEGRLGGQYAGYAEIAVKRELTRDGQSTYYLNGTRCRRRDIADIFLGTGLGPRSYAIIEQGTISRLVEAKPEDLRLFIEEAAGISKYKERRRETENRLRHTRDNLSRINDIIGELQKRLDYLQRQSQTAEKFKVLKQEERVLKGQLLTLRWRSLDHQVATREQAIHAQDTLLEQHNAELRKIETAIEHQREQQREGTDRFNDAQGEFYSIGADIARIEQSIQHNKQVREQQKQDLTQLQLNLEEIRRHLEQDRRQVDSVTARLREREPALEQAHQTEMASAKALGDAERTLADWQLQWDQFHTDTSAHARSTEVERTRIEHREQQLQELDLRRHRLGDQKDTLNLDEISNQISSLKRELENIEQLLNGMRDGLQTRLTAIANGREQADILSRQIEQDRGDLHALQKQLASLEARQQAALGQGQAAATPWLEAHHLDKAERLVHQLEVEDGWERAVETVLGFHLEAIGVDDIDTLVAEVSNLKHGALSLIDIRRAAPESSATATTLAARVRSPWHVDSFLNNVYTADDLDAALAHRATLDRHESVITREGIWLGRNWLRVSRDDADNKAGVLQREHDIKVLRQQVDAAEARLSARQAEYTRAGEALKTLEGQRDRQQAEVIATADTAADLQARLSAKRAHEEQLRSRREQLEREIAEVDQQLDQARHDLTAARARLDQAATATQDQTQQRDALLQQRDRLRAEQEEKRRQARVDQELGHEIAVDVETLRTQLASSQESLERMQHQFNQLNQRRDELQDAIAQGDAPEQALTAQLERSLTERVAAENKLSQARQALEHVDLELRRLQTDRSGAEQRQQEVRAVLEQLRLERQEVTVRRQTVLEQITETGQQLQELLDAMPGDAEEHEWEQRVDAVDKKIQRLGPINLAAIDEFAEQSQRKTYLDEQHADLNEAVATLESAIRRIDRETRERFKATFDRVNNGLQELFPRLFGGGQAYLEMTGEDLLETGIAVMARPPGKRNSTIHLLSGGEKALTAIALVFSIFELNPAPFCILDEVDAPLDDTNVVRYSQLVNKMSERVQFIYITHNKISMEMAHQLIGVTMHEPGVSRLVEVDVDEAVELAVANG